MGPTIDVPGGSVRYGSTPLVRVEVDPRCWISLGFVPDPKQIVSSE